MCHYPKIVKSSIVIPGFGAFIGHGFKMFCVYGMIWPDDNSCVNLVACSLSSRTVRLTIQNLFYCTYSSSTLMFRKIDLFRCSFGNVNNKDIIIVNNKKE